MDALKDTPKYSFGIKTQPEKPINTPGERSLIYFVSSFSYFINSQIAPGTYSPEKCSETYDSTPKYSFGLKPQLEKPSNTPGIFFWRQIVSFVYNFMLTISSRHLLSREKYRRS